jgi:hypothetical protein
LWRPQLLIPVVRQSKHWRMAINRNQNLLGKLLIALRRHEEQVAELTPAEWSSCATSCAGPPTGCATDLDRPGHCRPGVEYIAPPKTIAAIADAFDGP